MLKSTFTLDPSPLLFDVSTLAGGELPAKIERVALEHIELAANPRRQIGEGASTGWPRCSAQAASSCRASAGVPTPTSPR